MQEMKEVMGELGKRRENVEREKKLGWYLRYCKEEFENGKNYDDYVEK